MSSRNERRDHGAAYPDAEPHGNGTNNRDPFEARNRAATKTHQLCRQVEEAVSLALACATNPVLRDLYVAGVEPVRGPSLLRVRVSMEGTDYDYQLTERALDRALGYLRGEVARAINRKRVPTLRIAVVPSDDGDWEDCVGL